MIRDRAWPAGLAAVLAATVLATTGGPVGIVAGLALVGAWYVLGPLSAIVVGQVAVAAFADGLSLPALVAVEATLLAVLLARDGTQQGRRRVAASTVVVGGSLGLVAYGTQTVWQTEWATAMILVGVVALAAYILHRYERVTTGALTNEQ